MKAVAFATLISTASAGGSLSLSFKDCGATHAVTTDVQPTTLDLGADTAITGTGSLDKTVSGGTYDMELKAGGGLIDSHFTGNNCEAKDFTLPLGLGTLSWDGIKCPLAAADSVSIGFHTKLASSLPAALATSDIHLAADDQDGESVLCVDLHLAKQKTVSMHAHQIISALKDVLEGHTSVDFLEGFTGDSNLSECIAEIGINKGHKIWDECRDMDKDDKELAPFMAGLTDVHGIQDFVHAILNALKQHFLDNDGEILDLLGDMMKVCTFTAPDGHKCAADLGRIVRAILFGSTVVV